jgi:ribosomal protein S25
MSVARRVLRVLELSRGLVVTADLVRRVEVAILEGGTKDEVIDRIERVVRGG